MSCLRRSELPSVPCGSSQGLAWLPLEPAANRVLCRADSSFTRQMVPDLLTALPRNRVVSRRQVGRDALACRH